MISKFYRQSNQFQRAPRELHPFKKYNTPPEPQLLDYVMKYSQKGNPEDVINKIDEFCSKRWMMNLGPQKGHIVKKFGFHQNVEKILQIGGYCGYSALVFANQIKNNKNSKVFTIQINKYYAQIASKIHQHAGLGDKIYIHIGTVSDSLNFIKQVGPFDMIFIDHVKNLYLYDFKLIQANGGVKKGTRVVGDNIIYPGAPQYLAHFQQNNQYDSTLYHTYLQYSNDPDAVLVSIKN